MSSKDENYQRLPLKVSEIQKEYTKTKPVKAGYRAGTRNNRPAYMKKEIGFKVGGRMEEMVNVQLDQLKDIHYYLESRYSKTEVMARNYTDLVIYLTNDPVFENQFKGVFELTDVDNDGTLNENEWVDFCKTTYALIKKENP